jgi:hypothetical protein
MVRTVEGILIEDLRRKIEEGGGKEKLRAET